MAHHKPQVNIVVKPTDTLFFLAGAFKVTIEEILEANPGITDPDVIFPGQIIAIPAAARVAPDPGFARAQHLVRQGDTLFLIARQFGISLDSLIEANPQIIDPNRISVNQVINLPVEPPLPPDPPRGTIQIYVSVTETLTSIAGRISVSVEAIIDANPQIVDPNIIFVGQIINVSLT